MGARTWTDEQLIEAVQTSFNLSEVSRKLGLETFGANSRTIKKHIQKLSLDTSHFWSKEERLNRARQNSIRELPLEDILCVNTIDRGIVKRRLIKNNLLPYECAECKLTDWNNKPISLALDHINGNGHDNRLENLRFLCPNCHSQTETYCGRKLKDVVRAEPKCMDCNTEVAKGSTRCKVCAPKARLNKTKIEWPTTNTLHKMVEEFGYSETGRKLGVSGNAIKKKLRKNGIVLILKTLTRKL